MKKELKNLTEKQDKEFDEEFGKFYISNIRKDVEGVSILNSIDIKTFIAKIRKETAEYVCDRIIEGNKILFTDGEGAKHWENGYNIRLKEEKEIKKQILKEL